ncbi:NUDIX hydrolase [Streptomyces lincolnensis]|uniref:NUDIX hydrolase n=1 Tax=Streptomyces lincolnensis TaxID=1915 RepID=UPI0037D1F28D
MAIAVIVDGGRLLLIRRSLAEGDLLWAMPGGKVEEGESPEQAAVRETLEETGLVVEALHQLGARTHPDTGWRIVYVACHVQGGAAHAASPREVSEVAWVPPRAVSQYVPRGLYPPVHDYVISEA